MFFDDLIIPGEYGVGTRGYSATDDGYNRAADALVELHRDGRYVDTSDYGVSRVLQRFGASSLDELKVKRRGW